MKKLLQLLGIIKPKARTNSLLIDKDGNHWLYLRKVNNGYLFRNNLGRIKTLESTRIFKGYKF
jgi:hypothetical protein